ncbi:MAG TPA: hypothetical protein VMU48_00360 [Terracidiphilus sp.]|nr:hypothetical protein [Terracidiphilus sp.]
MDASDSSHVMNVSEMNAQIPRKVRFDSNSIAALSVGFLISLSGLAVLAWLSLDTAKDLRIQSTLVQDGRLVNGTITASSVNHGGTNVKYTFIVDSVSFSGQAQMKADNFNVPGDPHLISIRYLPSDPRVNQPANWKWVSVWDLFPFVLLIAMTAVGVRVVIMTLRLTNLARNGLVVIGRVTGCTPKRRLFTVFYVFTSKAKEEIEGSCDLLEEYDAGTAIPIIYLQSNPKRNAKYPVAGFSTTQ